MNKLVMMFVVALLIAACPIACVNDPTLSDETGSFTDADTDTATSVE